MADNNHTSDQNTVSRINSQVDGLTNEVMRFWDNQTQSHFFTTKTLEIREKLNNPSRYVNEGNEFDVPDIGTPGALPVYRYQNQNSQTYFYTFQPPSVITNEYPVFNDDGIAFYAFPSNQTIPEDAVPIFRFYNEGASNTSGTPIHFFTGSESNKQDVIDNYRTFKYEGSGWFAYPYDYNDYEGAPPIDPNPPLISGYTFTGTAGNDLLIGAGNGEKTFIGVASQIWQEPQMPAPDPNDPLKNSMNMANMLNNTAVDRRGRIYNSDGSNEFDTLVGATGQDNFVLGADLINNKGFLAVREVFYSGPGFATIQNFNSNDGDRLEVVGNLGDYSLSSVGDDLVLSHQSDQIAVITRGADLQLTGQSENGVVYFA
ncbi:MAG: hypothetical protein ACRDB1_12960 [Microcoleaceae cyanobacterium]